MPYQGERASKISHGDFVKNPDVAEFLSNCSHLTEPSEEEGKRLAQPFVRIPVNWGSAALPERVISTDGSSYESSINDLFPSTKVGYVKVGSVLINMAEFNSLRVGEGRFVDPFRVARLLANSDALSFALPSANVVIKGKGSIRESFRQAVDDHLASPKTRFVSSDSTTSLRTTLFHMASRRSGPLGTGDTTRLRLHKCPTCEHPGVEVMDLPSRQVCPQCGSEVYPADCLRLWEEISDVQSNMEPFNRFMMLIEHLMPMHYLRFLLENSAASLSTLAFFVDGPLAVFGNCAWLHGSIMRYLQEVRDRLSDLGQPMSLIIGLQKTGQVVDHVKAISRYIPPGSILPLDDDYRYRYILSGQATAANGFGHETYYGQDFIYKTASGKFFVFGLPYPFPSKAGGSFVQEKVVLSRYDDLCRALRLITHFESDLYENAVVPIALAHRYTAISLVPGGKVLDLLTRRALDDR